MRNNKTKPPATKSDKNAGSGAFNQGSKQDNTSQKVISISGKEKRTGHRPLTSGKKKS